MALQSTIPIIEVKTSGANLALVETMYVTIKQGEFVTVKSNNDIEVDNDLILVTLSSDEALQINGSVAVNVSVTGVSADGNVFPIKTVWAKRGSRTAHSGSGEAGPPGPPGFSPEITENTENTEKIYKLDITTQTGSFTTPNLKGGEADLNGLSFGQDEEGNWGYIPPGADTVIPFKVGGSGSAGNEFILGNVPSTWAGSVWLYLEEDVGASSEIAILSSVPNSDQGGLWAEDGEPLALRVTLASTPSDKIGAVWFE